MENERVSFAAIFYGGDSRAATRAIGGAESTRELRANPLANTAPPSVLFAQETHPRSHVERAVAPAYPPWAVRGCCGEFKRCGDALRKENDVVLYFCH